MAHLPMVLQMRKEIEPNPQCIRSVCIRVLSRGHLGSDFLHVVLGSDFLCGGGDGGGDGGRGYESTYIR